MRHFSKLFAYLFSGVVDWHTNGEEIQEICLLSVSYIVQSVLLLLKSSSHRNHCKYLTLILHHILLFCYILLILNEIKIKDITE